MIHFTIKNHTREIHLLKNRIFIATIILVLLTLFLLSRLVYLQIFQHKYYTTLSNNNKIDLIPIPPRRGLIFDRNGTLLAKNVPVFSLIVIPSQVKNIQATIDQIKKIIPLSNNDIDQFHKQYKQHRRFEQIPLKIKLSEEDVARFEVNRYRFPGVSVKTQLSRIYPFGKIFAHVIGYVGRINTRELSKIDPANYAATNFIGKIGIEKFYEQTLHGKVGYEKIEIDANGQIIRTISSIPSIRGDNIYLSIDSKLQMAAEKALDHHRGSIVAIQPSTGQILALVSHPSYDPNVFVTGITHKDFNKLQNNKNHPLYNRALRGLYAPGSTIKPFIAIGGLASGVTTPSFKIFDPGWFQLKNTKHIFHDWKRSGHGWVDLHDSIIQSCDTYFYDLAHKLGIRRLDDILDQFGFGKPTHIDMPEELSGNIPSPEWKFKIIGYPWYSGDTVNAGIGQGFMQVTPLQLSASTTLLANHGLHFQPHLLYGIQNHDSNMIPEQPIVESPLTLDDTNNWNIVINAMSKVITGSTGFRFGSKPPYTVAAKTGTAQVVSLQETQLNDIPEQLRDNSLFIAFAPIKNPKIALAVVIEHSPEAPVVARKVLDYYLLRHHSSPFVKGGSRGI